MQQKLENAEQELVKKTEEIASLKKVSILTIIIISNRVNILCDIYNVCRYSK